MESRTLGGCSPGGALRRPPAAEMIQTRVRHRKSCSPMAEVDSRTLGRCSAGSELMASTTRRVVTTRERLISALWALDHRVAIGSPADTSSNRDVEEFNSLVGGPDFPDAHLRVVGAGPPRRSRLACGHASEIRGGSGGLQWVPTLRVSGAA